MAEARIVTFCMQVDYQILAYVDKLLLIWAWSKSRDHFFIFCPYHIFVIGEARSSNFVYDTEEYDYMHDILLPKLMCSESHDLFKYWKISDNISLMVQDRDIVAM